MNAKEAVRLLHETAAPGSRPGLEAVASVLSILGNPQDKLKFVHCAGTNGKGSVMAFLEAVLLEAGYHVGRFLSPSLFCYEEMFRFDGQMISGPEISQVIEHVLAACETIRTEGGVMPTVFELSCAVAFLWFARKECDLVLLEAGMGGKDDATNVIRTAQMAVLTSISRDHCAWLGDTVSEIARVKAGIIKEGMRVVLDGMIPDRETVLEEVREKCRETHSPLCVTDEAQICVISSEPGKQIFTYRGEGPYLIRLSGLFQISNAALCLEVVRSLRALGWEIGENDLKNGLASACWEGRFEKVHERPDVFIDGAHNPAAARELARSVRLYFAGKEIYMIFGVFSDKEYDKIIRLTVPYARMVYTVAALDNPRALPSALAAEAVRKAGAQAQDAGTATEALERALAAAGGEDVILVFGSLSFLHEVKAFFGKKE